eukprot:scaffold66413_cov60-Phaeocystis_antarctica.AAC.1
MHPVRGRLSSARGKVYEGTRCSGRHSRCSHSKYSSGGARQLVGWMNPASRSAVRSRSDTAGFSGSP